VDLGGYSINNNGVIAFRALLSGGGEGIFLATPQATIPEPATFILLMVGLVALILVKQRK
jgi:hypothetical protein